MWQIGVAFLGGHCMVHGLTMLPVSPSGWPAVWPPIWLSACVAVIVLAIALRFRVAWMSAFVLGLAWAWLHAGLRLSDDLAADLEGHDLLVRGYVASMPTPLHLEPQFEIDVLDSSEVRVPPRIRLAWYETDLRPAPGELWQFVVRLKRRNGFANAGGFDYEGHLFRLGIGATGYVRTDERNRRLAAPSLRYPVLRTRAWIAQRIALASGANRHLGILQGLAIGDTQAMQADEWRIFAATGTTHLMAISGLHISMIATLVAWCGGCVVWLPGAQRLRLTAVDGKALAGAIAAISYSCLAGLSVPTQRTLIMLCIFFAARWWRRDAGVANALGISLIAILLADPFAPLAAGAWLSFIAVAVILLAVAGRLGSDGLLRNFTHVQLAITIGMAPIVIGAFGGLSLVSPLANALAVPLFTIVLVPLVLVGTIAASMSVPAGAIILGWAAAVLDRCWPMIDWFASRPLAVWFFPTLSPLALLLLVAGCACMVAPAIWPIRCIAVLMCLPALLNRPERPAAGAFELDVLDVGQGLSVVVRTHTHALVFDTGPSFRSGRDTGELVVLPFLRSQGIRRIDVLMLSHGDLDHVGGMQSLLQGMATQTVIAGPSVASRSSGNLRGAAMTRCANGNHWQWDGVAFDVLHPEPGSADSDNDSSCVLRIAGAKGSALLTGDIEKPAEMSLLARGLPPTDVVVVAHHGSRSSSTAEFVHAAQAKFAIFAAGYRNRWGFPRPEVVSRWHSAGTRTLSTIEGGAISIGVDATGTVSVGEYRREHRHYWSAR